ncbi:hypothetical protein [Vitiosangium sp. GDMCC 1.1324]|uniref:hypothetical protein n=1 Tax=Vitiosangium sp. (strain GDMCC 1.1324) TaxID=2138576 RepID=UPI000D36D819|nr:hypothetical protein [Vitiosangium sp. GDMCC 1.1324]PTL81271.1 hypothetical protein DAT35_24460 [Vitiosangium sp. GDMCC 1.1324]
MLSRITRGLLAVFAVAVVLLGGESAQAQTYSPYPDGSILINSAVSSDRYVIAGGAKFSIPASEQPYFSNWLFTYNVSSSTLSGITDYPQEGTKLKERNLDTI